VHEDAFWSSSVAAIEFHPTLAELPLSNFFACPRLASVAVPEGNGSFAFADGVLTATPGIEAILFAVREITRLDVGADVQVIGGGAFTECERLASVSFHPDSRLSLIGPHAFFWSGLTEIVIPKFVTSIGARRLRGGLGAPRAADPGVRAVRRASRYAPTERHAYPQHRVRALRPPRGCGRTDGRCSHC
jgi:hypothetical protein